MGYRTVNHVPSIRTHAQAKQIFEMIKPIRGRSEADSRRPLGARRDADIYHIRMNGDDVECVLYKTPVVTFHTDDTITIKTDSWNTTSTHQFIWAITGCSCWGSGGKSIIRVGDAKYVISEQMKMKYKEDDNGSTKWEVLTIEDHYDWRIDRRKANAVRAKYKGFIKYLTGAMKLRTIQTQDYKAVEFSMGEMVEEFGSSSSSNYNRLKGALMSDEHYRHVDDKKFNKHMCKFIELISAQKEDNTADYYRAMLMLVGRCYSRNYLPVVTNTRPIEVGEREMLDKAYECMYKWHSNEVFTKVKLPVGKVPSRKYNTWV